MDMPPLIERLRSIYVSPSQVSLNVLFFLWKQHRPCERLLMLVHEIGTNNGTMGTVATLAG